MGNCHSEDKNCEANGAIRWLLGAGGAALLLSAFLFWADEFVMGGARARDIEHNKMLHELRSAQISLPSNANDPRQLLELDTQQEEEEHSHGSVDKAGHHNH